MEYAARGEYPPRVVAAFNREDGLDLVFRCPAGHETKIDRRNYEYKTFVLEKAKTRQSEDRKGRQ
jgi:hypothetical protein